MLDRANMNGSYWTCASSLAFHLNNLVLHSSLNETPHKLLYEKKPKLSFNKIFGCVADSSVEKIFGKTLDRTSQKGVSLGHGNKCKDFLVGIPTVVCSAASVVYVPRVLHNFT